MYNSVEFLFLKIVRVWLDKALANLILVGLAMSRGVDQMTSWGPFQPKLLSDSTFLFLN